jgi:hydroxymethylbilane synthase
MKKIRLASRGSPLAMAQAKMAVDFLSARIEAEFEIVEIKTKGDKNLGLSLSADGGSGLFTKEIELALLNNEADLAVHSAKDLPTAIPENLRLAGCLPRDAYRDVLAIRADVSVPSLIASSSPRRRSQLKKIFPNAVWSELRGNVHTRLSKIASGYADATVLSEAGLVRLGISEFENIVFKPVKTEICVPAVGQGIIALECRAEDFEFFCKLGDEASKQALELERAFLIALGGGCQSACAGLYVDDTFSFFHENTGNQKIDMHGKTFEEKLQIVRELASGVA